MVQKADPFDGCYRDIVEICDRRYDMWICLKMMDWWGLPQNFVVDHYLPHEIAINTVDSISGQTQTKPETIAGLLLEISRGSVNVPKKANSIFSTWEVAGVRYEDGLCQYPWDGLLSLLPICWWLYPYSYRVIPPVSRWSWSQLLMLIYLIPSYPIQSSPIHVILPPPLKNPMRKPKMNRFPNLCFI